MFVIVPALILALALVLAFILVLVPIGAAVAPLLFRKQNGTNRVVAAPPDALLPQYRVGLFGEIESLTGVPVVDHQSLLEGILVDLLDRLQDPGAVPVVGIEELQERVGRVGPKVQPQLPRELPAGRIGSGTGIGSTCSGWKGIKEDTGKVLPPQGLLRGHVLEPADGIGSYCALRFGGQWPFARGFCCVVGFAAAAVVFVVVALVFLVLFIVIVIAVPLLPDHDLAVVVDPMHLHVQGLGRVLVEFSDRGFQADVQKGVPRHQDVLGMRGSGRRERRPSQRQSHRNLAGKIGAANRVGVDVDVDVSGSSGGGWIGPGTRVILFLFRCCCCCFLGTVLAVGTGSCLVCFDCILRSGCFPVFGRKELLSPKNGIDPHRIPKVSLPGDCGLSAARDATLRFGTGLRQRIKSDHCKRCSIKINQSINKR
mmetsp:Transcript_5990/g.17035  ORF Transcript_5990/g.17035 Transcript_5990/m.17035 type:complete len:426 (-) Transcript_5990:98-1375(-)